jgi:putative sterol carrier protein
VSEAAEGWNRVIQWYITGEGNWYAEVKDQKVTMKEGKHSKPDISIWTDYDTVYSMATGALAPLAAVMSGKLRTDARIEDSRVLDNVFKKYEPER